MTTRTTETIDAELRAALPEHLRGDFDDLIIERNNAQNERDDALEEKERLTKAMPDEGTVEDYEEALVRVRYWLHDGLFLRKPIEPPQRILHVVERALGVG